MQQKKIICKCDKKKKKAAVLAVTLLLTAVLTSACGVGGKSNEDSVSEDTDQKTELPMIPLEETFLSYEGECGYTLWYPETLQPVTLYGYEGFASKEDPKAEVLIVPQAEEMELDVSYLEEAAGNFRVSGEYEQVTVSEIKKLTAENKNISIHMLEVVHDGDMERFYIVKGEEQTLLLTVSLEEEAVELWKAKITKMIQTISFDS